MPGTSLHRLRSIADVEAACSSNHSTLAQIPQILYSPCPNPPLLQLLRAPFPDPSARPSSTRSGIAACPTSSLSLPLVSVSVSSFLSSCFDDEPGLPSLVPVLVLDEPTRSATSI